MPIIVRLTEYKSCTNDSKYWIFLETRLSIGGSFINHPPVQVCWQEVLTTRSPRHVTFLSSNQWTVGLRLRPRRRLLRFLLWDYCDEAPNMCDMAWRDHWPGRLGGVTGYRRHEVLRCNVNQRAFQTRAEQAQARYGPGPSLRSSLDIRNSRAPCCIVRTRIDQGSTEIPGPCRYQYYEVTIHACDSEVKGIIM